jgi:hypothetical protein
MYWRSEVSIMIRESESWPTCPCAVRREYVPAGLAAVSLSPTRTDKPAGNLMNS